MGQTPQVTITAAMDDLLGALVPDSRMVIKLAGFGSQVPRISGTGLIVKTSPLPITTPGSGIIIATIWGNDVITPAGTYYTMTFFDDIGNVVQVNAYQFLAAGSYDLSAAPLYDPPPPSVLALDPVLKNPAGQALQVIDGSVTIDGDLIVTGTINGASSPFIVTPAAAPVFDGHSGIGFKLTLNQNGVAVFQNMAGKQLVAVQILQPATGPTFTFTWPANVRNGGQINPGNGSRSVQLFTTDVDGSLDAASGMQYSF